VVSQGRPVNTFLNTLSRPLSCPTSATATGVGTSLIRTPPPVGRYSSPMVILGGWVFLMGEVPLDMHRGVPNLAAPPPEQVEQHRAATPPLSWPQLRPHLVWPQLPYRGTSLIRKHPPPRTLQ